MRIYVFFAVVFFFFVYFGLFFFFLLICFLKSERKKAWSWVAREVGRSGSR